MVGKAETIARTDNFIFSFDKEVGLLRKIFFLVYFSQSSLPYYNRLGQGFHITPDRPISECDNVGKSTFFRSNPTSYSILKIRALVPNPR